MKERDKDIRSYKVWLTVRGTRFYYDGYVIVDAKSEEDAKVLAMSTVEHRLGITPEICAIEMD